MKKLYNTMLVNISYSMVNLDKLWARKKGNHNDSDDIEVVVKGNREVNKQ